MAANITSEMIPGDMSAFAGEFANGCYEVIPLDYRALLPGSFNHH